MSEPEEVGRKLAGKIEPTDSVIVADWQTKLGLAIMQRVPYLARWGTERFVSSR